MAAAAINDIVAWVLLALAVAVASDTEGAAMTPIWMLLSTLGFVVFMVAVIRLAAMHLIRRFALSDAAEGPHLIATLAGVMLAEFLTDLIGIQAIFGAFVLGMIYPKRELTVADSAAAIEDRADSHRDEDADADFVLLNHLQESL